MRLCAGIVFALLLSGCGASAERGDTQGGPAPEWTASLRDTFGLERVSADRCERPGDAPTRRRNLARQSLRLQAEVARRDLVSKVHGALGADWGQVWFDWCDRGRFEVGVPPAPASELRTELAAARRVLKDGGVLARTDFVAVNSTARELTQHQEALDDRFARLLDAGMISSGQDDTINAVIIHAWKRAADDDRRAVERAAHDAPVKVIIEWTDTRPIARAAHSDRLGVDG
jgi:hypothetical protein